MKETGSMTVARALRERFSCRHFLDREVPVSLIREIMADAFHSPSCENSQPWKVYVAGQRAMAQLREAYEANRKQKLRPDLDRRFDGTWTREMEPRIETFFNGLYEAEPRGNFDYTMQKRNLFYAPAMIFICLDEGLPTWSVFDIGLFSQSLMLSAVEHGLATMISAVSVSYPQTVRRVLGIPEHEKIFVGIGIGYADMEKPVNRFRTERKTTGEVSYVP